MTRDESKRINLPVDQHAAAGFKATLDEIIGLWEVLKKVFVVNVIDLYNHVLIILE